MSKPVQLKTPLGRLLAALLLVLLVWQLPALYRSAQGNIQYYVAHDALEKWQKGQLPSEADYQYALQAARQALDSSATSAHYMLTLAKVLEWGMHLGFERTSAERLNPLYRQAIALRPDWPNTYADYGFVLAFFDNNLPEAMLQLKQAEHYGPHMPEVLRQQLAVGLAHWDSLPGADKAWLLKVTGQAAEAHWSVFAAMRVLVKQYQREAIVCAYLFNRKPPLAEDRLKHLARLCARPVAP